MSDIGSEALEASITKWEGYIAAETPEDAEPKDCPLCAVFFRRTERIPCIGCSVFEKTGWSSCDTTPFLAAARSWYEWELYEEDEDRDEFRTNARAEVEFLKSCRKGASNE